MANKDARPKSNAEPMTYTRVRRPNLRNQRVRDGDPIAVPEAKAITVPLATESTTKKGGK